MDFKKAIARYKDLQKQLKKKKISQAQFAHEAAKIQLQDSQGNWWQINPDDGSWLTWDGSNWLQGDPNKLKHQPIGLPPGGPQSLVQLFVLMFKGIGKNFPKMLLQAVIIGFIIWIVHAYLLVVVNNGFLAKVSSWAVDIIALKVNNHNNVPQAAFFWTMVGWLVSYLIFTRIIGKGPINFIKDIVSTPGWVFRGLKQMGSRNIGIFLIITALGLALNFFIKNIYISGLIAVSFFLILTSRYEGLMYLIIRLAHSDIQRIFSRNKQARPFNDAYLIALLTGIVLSVVIYFLLPYRPYSAYLSAALLLGAGVFLMVKTRSQAFSVFFTVYAVINILWFLTTGAFARCDTVGGGWDASGGNFASWWANPGRNEALAAGNIPAAGGALGSLLGSLGNAFSSVVSTAGQAVRGTAARVGEGLSNAYQSVKETAVYTVDVAVGTVKNIGQDFVEAGKTIGEFAGNVWEGAEQVAWDTAQAARDIYNNPVLIFETFERSAGQIMDGVFSVAQETAQIARDVWNNPSIITDTIRQTGSDLVNIGSNIGRAIYTTITDPRKAWEFIREASGINNFQNSLDPNRSLISRIGQVGLGTMKLASSIMTAGKAGVAIKAGASQVAGIAGAIKTGKTAAVAGSIKTGKTVAGGASAVKTAGRSLPVARPSDASNIAAFRNAQIAGKNKVDSFIDAIKSKDPARIKEATLRIQGDNQAIANLNDRNNFIKNQFNRQMQDIYRNVDQRTIERLARDYNVRPDQIRVVSATNPNRSLTNVKVGFDRDITYKIGNKDIPADKLQEIYNQEFRRVTGGADPTRLGQQAVDRLHAEAYGRQASDLQKALSGQSHRIVDSQQIGKTISYKAHHSFQEAARAAEPGVSQRHMFDGMRQVTKQWNNQIKSTMDYLNSTSNAGRQVRVPARLQEAIRIMDQVNHGVSPAEITQQLRSLGMTPTDVATQAGDFFDTIIRLR